MNNFDQNNEVIRLCIQGIEAEGKGDPQAAKLCYEQAWQIAANDFERFTAAHYIARQQNSVEEKLAWDKTALQHALNIPDAPVRQYLPSLYLNIAKCYEDLHDHPNALLHYQAAEGYTAYLTNDGYGNMIKSGIDQGISRLTNKNR